MRQSRPPIIEPEGRAMSIFDRYAPFVQDFIYDHQWENLRSIQVAAGDAIFNTDENVLLTASTASGKTEAAFFPILSLFWEDPPTSIGAIYVGPLKALINDQFLRLNDLCEEAEIPVWHWHGDVAASHKRKLLEHPSGILQITPESLEALLMHKHMAVPRLFHDLRFVVIDEVHSLLRGDRGGQTLCLIERLSRMAGVNPRRIGLSATIGDPERTGAFLASGTGRGCIIPRFEEPRRVWRLSMEHFYITGPQAAERAAEGAGTGIVRADGSIEAEVLSVEPSSSDLALARSSASYAHLNASEDEHAQSTPEDKRAAVGATRMDTEGAHTETELLAPTDRAPENADPGIGYIFERTRGRKCLVFANSREEAEAVCTMLRSYCEANHEPDRFLIHHGNLSASIRESAEDIMRDDERLDTTVTTATLELGIDIGRLERAFQIDAPFTVSSFLQRMGRTGRRDLPPEMHFVMREEQPEPRTTMPETIPWKLLQGIALVQLYHEERWVEPPALDRLPYSLLYHQTMATLASTGELSPAELAQRVLTLSYFHRVSADDFRVLLAHQLVQVLCGVPGKRGVHGAVRERGARHDRESAAARRAHCHRWRMLARGGGRLEAAACVLHQGEGARAGVFWRLRGRYQHAYLGAHAARAARARGVPVPARQRASALGAGAPHGGTLRRGNAAAHQPWGRHVGALPVAGELRVSGAGAPAQDQVRRGTRPQGARPGAAILHAVQDEGRRGDVLPGCGR